MATCPNNGNTTETLICLLQSISANTVSSYNIWDPLNFASTAFIGILALIVAGVTVFQGLLAAGPGRLKASSLAIGPFSIHSESHFDWTEYGLRTTARVPLITWDVVYHRVVRQKFRPDSEACRRNGEWGGRRGKGWQSGRRAGGGKAGANERDAGGGRPNGTTATWLNLLAALGLDDPQMFPLIERATDYLPTDVQAAPAAGELRCLAILALCADSGASIELVDRFVKVDADSSQLGFRDHPTLGQLAAYDAYEETAVLKVGDAEPIQFGSRFPMISLRELDRCLQLASGRLAYADGRLTVIVDQEPDTRSFMTLVGDLQRRAGNCNHEICMHAVEDWGRVSGDLVTHQRLKAFGPLRRILTAVSLLAAERANLCRGFPKEKLSLSEALDEIMELSSFWREDFTFAKMEQLLPIVRAIFWSAWNVPWRDECSASWVVDFQDTQSQVPNAFPRRGFSSPQTWKAEALKQALMSTRVWLQGRKTPAIADYERNTLTASSVATMLAALDHWLLVYGGSTAACSMLKKMYQLGKSSSILTTSRQGSDERSQRSSVVLEEDVVVDGSTKREDGRHLFQQKVDGHIQIEAKDPALFTQEHMSMLLVFRGILMALMLDMGADTSVLYESEFRESIVKII